MSYYLLILFQTLDRVINPITGVLSGVRKPVGADSAPPVRSRKLTSQFDGKTPFDSFHREFSESL